MPMPTCNNQNRGSSQTKGSKTMNIKLISLLAALFFLAACTSPQTAKPDTLAPDAPIILLALPGDAEVTVSWQANSEEDLDTYQIFFGETEDALTEGPVVKAAKTEANISGLNNGIKYFFAVQAIDLSGNNSESSVRVEATPVATDSTAPILISSSPVNGALNVASTSLSFFFSEAMDIGSVSVSISPDLALGEAIWNETANQLSFTPVVPFDFATNYSLLVTGSDPSGNALAATNISFTTQAVPDTTAPEILSNTPSNGATGIDTGTNLSLSFSEAMNRSSVEAAFSVNPAANCLFLWSSDDKLVTCDPTGDLNTSTPYTVELAATATDQAGNTLANPFSFSFDTAAAPDTTAPTFIGSTPDAGLNGISQTANISISFNEPMDKASAQTAFSITSPAGFNAGSYSWNAQGTVMTYNPDNSFDYGNTIIWKLSTAAKDLAGNELGSDISHSFKVIRQTTVKIYSTASLDGSVSNLGEVLTEPAWVIPDGIVGDLDNNTYRRTFLSFDLSSLPTDLKTITTATLYVRQFVANGTAYSELGKLTALHVSYGSSLTGADFETPVIGLICKSLGIGGIISTCPNVLSTNANLEFKSLSATTKLRDDWQNRATRGARSQYRLQFTKNATANNNGDLVAVGTGDLAQDYRPYIQVTYEYP